jgi:hypothetical protein
MTSYECPVCGVADVNAYLRCNRPDCTDGRDPVARAFTFPNRPLMPREAADFDDTVLFLREARQQSRWPGLVIALGIGAALVVAFHAGRYFAGV